MRHVRALLRAASVAKHWSGLSRSVFLPEGTQFNADARKGLAFCVPSTVMINSVGSRGAVRALSSAPIDDERRTDREFIDFLKSQLKELQVQIQKERDVKETQMKELQVQIQKERDVKETQLKELQVQIQKERDARDALQEERLTLSHKRAVLERERMAALAALGEIDLRRVLETIFPVGSRDKKGIQAFVEGNGMLLDSCRAEPKIQAEACDRKTKQVSAESIAIELRRIWDDLHSDAHLQLSVEEWKTCRPQQPVVLRVNGITQARVLLLYHLLDHCGYPVEADGVIPKCLR